MSALFGWPTTTFDKLFEKATSHLLLEPDWESILQICDSIRQGDVQPKYAVSCMKKKLYAQNPHVVLYTLQVLESCMKNCGSPIHAEVASKPFMEELRELVKSTTNENVRNRILELVQTWAYAFRNESKYRAVQDTLNMLKVEGYKLPTLKESDAMFVADTAPNWADGDCCHRCRTQFSVVIRKHHCRNCGQIFCNKCSSRNCPIPRFGIEKEVRVCEACWEKLSKPSSSKSTSNQEVSPQHGTQESSGEPPQKSEQELKEEEDLQLALALSQSEAESKDIVSEPPVEQIKKSSPVDSELDRYLNRTYWEQRQQQQKDEIITTRIESKSPVPTAPVPNSALMNANILNRNEKFMNGDIGELTDFLSNLRTTVEIFENRMKSNSSRGRPIANDTHVQSLFMNITNMHSQLLKYVQEQDDLRAYYERLQDKLSQARDARAALDALRDEHREQLNREAEEAERQRQIQMAHKLEIMRKKKQEYLQYQRQLALQRMQEQEREMQMRHEQQKQQYQVPGNNVNQGGYPPQHAYVASPNYTGMHHNGANKEMIQKPYHGPYDVQQVPVDYRQQHNMQAMPPGSLPPMPSGAQYPQTGGNPVPQPQMMMAQNPIGGMPAPMGMMPQGNSQHMIQQNPPSSSMHGLPQSPVNNPDGTAVHQLSPQHQAALPQMQEAPCDPLIVFD